MSWLLSVPWLLVTGAAALLLLPALICRPASTPRLVAEVFGTTLAVIALIWLGWATLWSIGRR